MDFWVYVCIFFLHNLFFMKKIFIYWVFGFFAHPSFGQLPLIHPQDDDKTVPGFSNHPLSAHLRPVQSRNFVELQLDSIIYTLFDTVGQSDVDKRFLYSYSGDTTLINSFYRVGDSDSDEYFTKLVYNPLNLIVYEEVIKISGTGGWTNSHVSQYEYYPNYPSVIKSKVENWQSMDNLLNFVIEEDYFLIPGTALLSGWTQKTDLNGVEISQKTLNYEYDAQEREVMQLTEQIDIVNDNTEYYRISTSYSTNASVAVTESKGEGSPIWNLRHKYEKEFYPGTTLLQKDNWFNWSGSQQEWVPYREYVFTYDADNRKEYEVLASYLDGVFWVKSGIKTNYVQDNYIDKNVRYTFYYGDSTVYATEQFYYAMPSSTTQPNAETPLVELAPNPALAYLRARTEQNIQLAELYDLQGRLVMNIATEGTNVLHLHRNNLPGGTYVLRLQLENGATVSERVQWK